MWNCRYLHLYVFPRSQKCSIWMFQHSSFYTIWHCRPQVRNIRERLSPDFTALQRGKSLFLLFVFLQIKRPFKNPTMTWTTWEEEGWNQDFVKYGTQKRKFSGKNSMTSAWTCNQIGSYRVHMFRVGNTLLCQSSWNCKCSECRIEKLIPFSSFSEQKS